MNKAIIGKKIGMSQIFTTDGKVIPVTVVEAGPCPIVQKKTVANDGYDAVQVAFGEVKATKVTKPVAGHFKKANVEPKRYLRELKFADCSAYEVGQTITCDSFAGVIQRWNQHRGPMAHGSGYHRGVGSMSACSDPSRVFKNKHMPGQWGGEKVTVQNLTVAKVDKAKNILLIKGAIPGPKGGLVVIKESLKG